MRLALAVRRELCGMAAALAFLTRLPVPRDLIPEGGELARGAIWFPLAGATVGAVTAGVGAALAGPVAPPVAGVCALATSIVLTGALHLDGLADTADALGARTPDDALLVMRDPRVGAFGVTAIAVLLLAEAGALGALLERERFAAIVTAFALARHWSPRGLRMRGRVADSRVGWPRAARHGRSPARRWRRRSSSSCAPITSAGCWAQLHSARRRPSASASDASEELPATSSGPASPSLRRSAL
jgi:hypothetical protein